MPKDQETKILITAGNSSHVPESRGSEKEDRQGPWTAHPDREWQALEAPSLPAAQAQEAARLATASADGTRMSARHRTWCHTQSTRTS